MFVNTNLTKKVMVDNIDQVITYYKKLVKDEAARDPRYFMSFLMKLPEIDSRLFGLIYFRKQAIQKFAYTIKFPDEHETTEAEKKQLAEMKDRWYHSRMHSLLDSTMNARMMGMSAVRLDWDHSDTYKNFVVQKESYPLTDMDFDLKDDDKIVHIDTNDSSTGFTRKEFDPAKTFTVRFNPMSGFENDFPGGFVRINWIRVLLKYWDFFNWSRDNEKSAIIASYEERFKQYLDDILDQLDNISENGVGAFPKGIEVNSLHKLSSEMIKSHSDLEQSVDRSLAFSIAGTTSIYEAKGGSYARDMVGYEIAEDVTYGDLVFVEREITSQYIIKDYQLNYSKEPRNAFPVFEFKKRTIKDTESHARIVTDYINSGIGVTAENVYDDLNLQRPPDCPEVIKSTRPQII